MTICILEEYFNRLKKYHKNYNEMEDSHILSKYVIEDDLYSCDYNDNDFKTIDDVQKMYGLKIKWKFGDLVSFSSYRDTWTYIVGKEGKLFINPPYDGGAGYLCIPYDITKYLKNSKYKYSFIDVLYMDMRHDDDFIIKNIGVIDPNLNLKFRVCFHECDSDVTIISPNGDESTFLVDFTNQIKWQEFIKCKNKINESEDCLKVIKIYLGAIDSSDINLLKI